MKNPDAGFLSLRCKTIKRANCGGIATKEGWLSAGHAHVFDQAAMHDATGHEPTHQRRLPSDNLKAKGPSGGCRVNGSRPPVT
jgi:hypothetical protein